MNPKNTVFDAKRVHVCYTRGAYAHSGLVFTSATTKQLIGREFKDASVQGDMKHWYLRCTPGASFTSQHRAAIDERHRRPFKVIEQDSKPMIQVFIKTWPA